MIKKKVIAWGLCLTMAFSVAACGGTKEAIETEPAETIEKIAATEVPEEEPESVEIQILATSDVHGRFVPWEYATDEESMAGSLTQISSFVKEEREINENTILVDCGDSVQDNYVETFIGDDTNPMVTAMNEMKYDVWVMGNHEYNFSRDERQKFIDQFNGIALSGNVYQEDGTRYLPATTIIEKAGVKIGIVGMTTPLITEFEAGKDSLDGLQVKGVIEETQKALDELEGQVDAIVAVIHMGEENENNIAGTGVIDVANACPDIDVIVAGHMHLNVSSNVVNEVLITEPYKYGRAVSDIKLKFSSQEDGYELIEKNAQTVDMADYVSDKELEDKLAEYHDALRALVNEPIGKLVGSDLVEPDEIIGISRVYTEPTGIMNLFLNVARHYSEADVVVLGTDNENAQIKVGDICLKDIAKNYTYTGGEVTVYEMTGAELKQYMEWSADYFNTLQEGDLTISYNPERRNSKYSTNDIFGGINYQIDLREETGNRIKNMTLYDGTKVTPELKVKVGMNSYRMGQLQEEGGIFEGKEFPILYSSIESFGEEEGTIRNLTIKYIKEECAGILEGDFTKNWEIIGIDKESEEYQLAKKYINDGTIMLPMSEDGVYSNVKSITVDDIRKVE